MGRPYRDLEKRRVYFRKRYYKRKLALIEFLGGCCTICSSKLDLHFDHIDPSYKKFAIGSKLNNAYWGTIMEEIKKCQLLCADCHRKKTKSEQRREG